MSDMRIYLFRTKDGRTITVEFVSNVYDVNGQKVIQCNIRDITKRRSAEQSEQRIQQAQKMEAIGQLAGGIAHDFNNMLGVVLGYCELVLGQTDLSETTRTRVVEIQGAGTSAKNLTERLLAFGHRQVSRPIFFNLNETVSRVDSNGTAFKVYFPRWDAAAVVSRSDKIEPVRGGTETILLVDDAEPLRRLTRMLLEESGYTVLDSGDPRKALRIAERHIGMLPLMITDVVMPGFSGPVLAEKIAETRPKMRVLFTSGYADDEIAKRRALGPDRAFLEKPFTRAALMTKVRELLDSPFDRLV